MTETGPARENANRNVRFYPWFRFCQYLIFWQAVWFLFFQTRLSAADAILLYVVYDIATTALEVPSGYLSDRIGRRRTLILAALSTIAGTALLAVGDGFAFFALGQALLGAGTSFTSGTDSSLLYESLRRSGRESELEAQEMRTWRFGFVALALSAASGGAMALFWDRLPFLAGLGAGAGMLVIATIFSDPAPSGATSKPVKPGHRVQWDALRAALTTPVLQWLFGLSVAMYTLSHVPFVFGQPYILEALRQAGLAAEAPMVSGTVSSAMMLLSVAASWLAVWLRRKVGLAAVLLTALAMQIGLIAGLSLSGSLAAIALLLLRMVPDSLSRPFIVARVQPLLHSEGRATYLSMVSFCGRLVFAGSLWLASFVASSEAAMVYAEIRVVLIGYAAAGGLVWIVLWRRVRRIALER